MRPFLVGVALGAAVGVAVGLGMQDGGAPGPASAVPDTLVVRERVLDTVYLRDTVRLTRTRTRTDSVLVYLTDTLIHRDTVKVLVEAERRACDAALGTCEGQKAVLREQRDSASAAYRREAAKPKASLKRDAAMGAAGAAVLAILQAVLGG